MRIIAGVSCLVIGVACLTGTVRLLRAHPRRGWFFPLGLAFVLLTGWVGSVVLYLGSPYGDRSARVTLAATCVALGPWLWVALTTGAGSVRTVTRRWGPLLVACAAATASAAAMMWWRGIDWITGIGSQPATILTQVGLGATALALLPVACTAVVLGARFPRDIGAMPGVTVGTIGAFCSVTWVATAVLWRGYLTTQPLTSAAALAAVAATIWAASVVRRLPATRPLSPSRPLVYGAAALALVLGYVIAARFAFRLLAPLAAALPEMLPALAFAAAAGLVVSLGSRRFRHSLWVAVGRYLFLSKHDYGAVWVRLTRLVTEARSASDLVQRVAVFCRDLLCVDTVSVYLYDPAGVLRPAAFARPGRTGITAPPATGALEEGQEGTQERDGGDIEAARWLARKLAAAFVCPMRVNGRRMGFIAVGEGGEKVSLDEEDHQVMAYISAQVASALGLYRLGEEIADAREVGSFHRLSAFIIHDLKNLVAQQSFVLQNAPKFGGDPAFVADALDAFADSTSRMRSLIARLRTDEANLTSTSPVCDAIELIREITSGPRLTLPGGCSLRLTVPEGVTACHVRADRGALAQVFTNLLVNAVESLPPDRGAVEVTVRSAGAAWRIEVSDNGCGMPEAYLREHLFHPFRSTKEGGMGIGLYHCKVLVEAAAGTIGVHSQPGRGTTVTVQLPAAPPSEGASNREGAPT
jgi:signal transduction histidine kinase